MHIAEEETLKMLLHCVISIRKRDSNILKEQLLNLMNGKIKQECKKIKVEFLCSPFSMKAVDILEKLKVEKYKIPSGELTNLPY